MLSRFKAAVTVGAIAAALLVAAFAAGCGGGDQDRAGTRRIARQTGPSISKEPPVSSAPKAAPVEEAAAKVEEKPEAPKVVAYEDAEAAYNRGQYGTAVELFTVYTGNRDENPWGFYMLGLSAWKAGDHELAEESFEKALALAPGHVKSMLNLARVLLDTGRAQDALARVEAALEEDPGSNIAYRLEGRALEQLGRSEEAIEAYRRAISIDDRDAWAMNNMALILIGQERFEEALLPLARATMIDTTRAVFWNNLGMALERTGRFRSAEAAYGAAFEADEGHDRAYANLARVQGVIEQPGTGTIELKEYAQRFIEEMEDWKTAEAGGETNEVTALTESQAIGIAVLAEPDTSKAGP